MFNISCFYLQGRLQDGRNIAVKTLSIYSRQGETEFRNEALLVAKLQHRNMVGLLGFCSKGTERLLVYEFVPNASLECYLRGMMAYWLLIYISCRYHHLIKFTYVHGIRIKQILDLNIR